MKTKEEIQSFAEQVFFENGLRDNWPVGDNVSVGGGDKIFTIYLESCGWELGEGITFDQLSKLSKLLGTTHINVGDQSEYEGGSDVTRVTIYNTSLIVTFT